MRLLGYGCPGPAIFALEQPSPEADVWENWPPKNEAFGVNLVSTSVQNQCSARRTPPSTILDPLLITPVEIAIPASRVAETHVSTQRRECVAAPPTLPGLRRLLPAMVTSQRSAIRATVARPRSSTWLSGYRGAAMLARSRLCSHPKTRQTDNYGKIFARLVPTVW